MSKPDSSEVLSKEETERLFADWSNKEAKKEFFNHNVRLANHIAKKYLQSGIEYEDLFQLANLGLWKAVQTFDPNKGFQFATYAGKVINNEILMQLRKGKGTPLVDERKVVSINAQLGVDQDGDIFTYEDILKADNINVEDDIIRMNLSIVIKEFINNYDPRYAYVIELHMCNLNQNEIAKIVNLSQSYISRVIIKFKKDLKKYLHNNWDINVI